MSSRVFKLGVRYFKPKNILILKREDQIGRIFVAVERCELKMFCIELVDYQAQFQYGLRFLKRYDHLKEVWVEPSTFSTLHEVSSRWFVGKTTFVQCDENEE